MTDPIQPDHLPSSKILSKTLFRSQDSQHQTCNMRLAKSPDLARIVEIYIQASYIKATVNVIDLNCGYKINI